MTIKAYIDGASRGNPGESGVGVVLKNEEGKVVHSAGGYIGMTTNNVAEYVALLECLKRAQALGCSKLVVHSDSELIVRQVQGVYRVKNEDMRKHFQRVHRMLQKVPFAFEIRHVAREENSDADMLANVGIDSKARLRPVRPAQRQSVQKV